MHLIRLLLSGIHLLRDQILMIDVGEYRDLFCMAVMSQRVPVIRSVG